MPRLLVEGILCCCSVTNSDCLSDSIVTTWTAAHQAPLSMGFPRQEYWNGLPFPSPYLTENTNSSVIWDWCYGTLLFISNDFQQSSSFFFIFLSLSASDSFLKFVDLCLWLFWVFLAVCRLSLFVSGGSSALRCAGFSLLWLLLLQSMRSGRQNSVVVACRLSSCGAWASVAPRGMWSLLDQGGRFLSTVPPGKPQAAVF